MVKGHTTCSPNPDLWIKDHRVWPSMASESRYMTMQILVAEVKKVMLPLHSRWEDYSSSMRILEEWVVARGMYPGTCNSQHRILFEMSIPISILWSRRIQSNTNYRYQLHQLRWSSDQQRVVNLVVLLQTSWRIMWVLAMKMMRMRMRTIHH